MNRSLSHDEDTLDVRPGGIRHTPVRSSADLLWWHQSTPRERRFDLRHGGRGAGFLRLPESLRQQHVIVKPMVATSHGGSGSHWYKHGAYLQREGAQGRSRGQGFSAEQEAVNISTTLAQWQREGDPHLFKLIISVRHGERLDLPTFARRLVAEKLEPDLGVQLQWMAIDHYNTGHPHIHLIIRGRDAQGNVLRIDGEYLWGGMRQRARELATQMLGLRTRHEITTEQQRAITARHWTALDRALSQKLQGRTLHADARLTPAERARVAELVRRGLAWVDGEERWELSRQWEPQLQQPSAKQQNPARERTPAHKDERDRQHEQGTDEQERRRRLVQIVETERAVGWER
jgi:hypothetical protein